MAISPPWTTDAHYQLHEWELEQIRKLRWARYAIECPSCGREQVLPSNDYLCVNCRARSSQLS